MAGHSKWKNIQHRKGRQDAKRAKIFTKLSKEIFAAARAGGAEQETNTRLRMALIKAREANMPNDNIERTIKKAVGDVDGFQYEEIVYEGYGAHGVAVLVEVLTDNRNRSAADIRHIFTKNGGNLGENGCVSFLFDRKGILYIDRHEVKDEEELMLLALDAGADDLVGEGEQYEIITVPSQFEEVKQKLEQAGVVIASSEITMVPQTEVQLQNQQVLDIIKLIDALEDHDDIQHVYTNADFDEDQLDV